MKPTTDRNPLTLAALIASCALPLTGTAQAPLTLEAGEARIIQTLPTADSPEGITLDGAGNIYFSNRSPENGTRVSRIMKIDTQGAMTTVATLGASGPQSQAVLGLEYARGYVYAAYASFVPATHGVWRIDAKTGAAARLAGSAGMILPNSLAFDPSGRLYVTDSISGSVWRFPRDPIHNPGTMWAQSPLLAPINLPGLIPPIGANGIAFHPDAGNSPATGTFYVAHTQLGRLAKVRLHADGTAGVVELVSASPKLLTIDGITVDKTGRVYGVIVGFAMLPVLFGIHTSAIVRIDPDAAPAERVTPLATDFDKFDFPLSIAFGRGDRDRQSVFVTNGDLFREDFKIGPGAGIVQAGLGVSGKN